MTRTQRIIGLVIGALFIALHLPFLPPSLEDLDSINFALGVRQYDISQHQPHPPGYPLFIGAAKLLHAVGLSELHALSVLGVLAGVGVSRLPAIGGFLEPRESDALLCRISPCRARIRRSFSTATSC